MIKKKRVNVYNFDAKDEKKRYNDLCNFESKTRKSKMPIKDYTEWVKHVEQDFDSDMHYRVDFEKYINMKLRECEYTYDLAKAFLIPLSICMLTIGNELFPSAINTGAANFLAVLLYFVFEIIIISLITLIFIKNQADYILFYTDFLDVVTRRNEKYKHHRPE